MSEQNDSGWYHFDSQGQEWGPFSAQYLQEVDPYLAFEWHRKSEQNDGSGAEA